ncbi:polysaccharide deacetylase family protein [Heliobacterium chlorum]|uniref:Polysaccharide deacetylase family protein n=1 Tax=Heliobacterium chlorum TaxID=2698 RepID=A0ABR7T526_HELCL|nr:polysaccharide deacetylase family protein [Heliobacterium chlorum]MBC9785182.1 polysaccharide deacetylase family protein [Heliobacterium chlorum]
MKIYILKKKLLQSSLLIVLLAFIGYAGFSFAMEQLEHYDWSLEDVSKSVESTDPNKKYGWGVLKPKNEEPPFVPPWLQGLLKEYGAIYMGDSRRKSVALTFDMGFELEGATPRILDVMAKHNVKGTFFLCGHWVKTQPDLLKRLISEGHTVGNHTWNHPSLPDISKDKLTKEIMVLNKDIEQASGCNYKAKYLRPPKGEFSRTSLDATKNLGFQSVFWSIATNDWSPMATSKKVKDDILNQLHPGAIILLHGNSKAVVDSFDDIIASIKAKGYTIVSLDEIQASDGNV